MIKKTLILTLLTFVAAQASAANYKIDTKGAHAFVQFRIQHLGYSWLWGRFDQFEGSFEYDEKQPDKASLEITIDTTSLNSNHTERDKHLRDNRYLNVEKHPEAKFVSSSFKEEANGNGVMTGNLTLNGVTKEINIDVELVGAGDDPWGGYRRGYEGRTTLTLKDFNYGFDLGPKSQTVEMFLSIEGIRQ
ncbi:YceI family protein [Marinicella sp. W31]|uniref:YceI family protein n=1 Tax=Marinicella sp. W31 TaxID=3023713 RepID=UPI00375632E7